MKELLEKLNKKYETPEFIKDDPIFFPHQYKDKKDIEISAFISSLFAFGKREMFIKKLNTLFSFSKTPYEIVADYKKYNLEDCCYRFFKNQDIVELLKILNKLYILDKSSLEELFYNSKDKYNGIKGVVDYFYRNSNCPSSQGFCFMFAKPENKSALKRLNMFLRWMIREGCVDFGIWNFIKKSDLIIPLDIHVGNISRQLGLLKRKQNDYIAALKLTEKLKEFDELDPIKYDFSLFGYGVNQLKDNL